MYIHIYTIFQALRYLIHVIGIGCSICIGSMTDITLHHTPLCGIVICKYIYTSVARCMCTYLHTLLVSYMSHEAVSGLAPTGSRAVVSPRGERGHTFPLHASDLQSSTWVHNTAVPPMLRVWQIVSNVQTMLFSRNRKNCASVRKGLKNGVSKYHTFHLDVHS